LGSSQRADTRRRFETPYGRMAGCFFVHALLGCGRELDQVIQFLS
jgi:hypothetical protein